MSEDREPHELLPGLEALSAAWASALAPSGAEGGGMAELAARLLDPGRWLGGVSGAAVEQPFAAIIGLPRLADVPAHDRRILALLQDWASLAQRSWAFNTLVAQVWLQAYLSFLSELQASAAEGKPVGSGRELLERWTATANATLLKAQRGDDFLAAQRRLLEAVLSSRTKEREIVEAMAEAVGLPTRTEVNDVHRTLQEVKRELRALKRQLAAEAAAREDAPPRRQDPGPHAAARKD